MLSSRQNHNNDRHDKDIFAPIADLMVGVVFIFIILMASISLYISEDSGVSVAQYERRVAEIAQLKTEAAEMVAEIGRATIAIDDLRLKNERLTEFAKFIKESRLVPLMERLTNADEARARLLGDVGRRLAKLEVQVVIDPQSGTIQLRAHVSSAPARLTPTIEGRDTIMKLGQVLAEVLPCYAEGAQGDACTDDAFARLNALYIEGHSDVVQFTSLSGRFRNNWDLSTGRAIEAFKVLRESQPILGSLRNQDGEALIGVSGYAETRPAARTQNLDRMLETTREKDRRIEVRITMGADEAKAGAILGQVNKRLEMIDELIR